MTWFFRRESEIVAYEVRRGPTHFEIATRRNDGAETIALAFTPTELLSRLESGSRALLQEGWSPRRV